MNTGQLLALGLLLATGINASAENRNLSPEQRQHRMREELQLNDNQTEQVREIMESAREERSVIKENMTDDRRAGREQMLALRERTHEQMMGVLDDEQQVKFEEMREKHMNRRKHGKGPHHGSPAPGSNSDDS
jgi:Spy/CpxP family protein refolding chaperone